MCTGIRYLGAMIWRSFSLTGYIILPSVRANLISNVNKLQFIFYSHSMSRLVGF
jgi:hypothetical protein